MTPTIVIWNGREEGEVITGTLLDFIYKPVEHMIVGMVALQSGRIVEIESTKLKLHEKSNPIYGWSNGPL